MRVKSPYIFISHSSKNNPFTKQLAGGLQVAGFNTWVDVDALKDGERWVAEIQTAVENCHAIVVVMSRAARESEWVERETLLALDLKKPLLIARVEDVPLPLQLITRQFTDFTGEHLPAMAKLVQALRTALNAPPLPTMPAVTDDTGQSEPITTVSADPNEDNFFVYLEQMNGGKTLALIARDLYLWAKQHADSVDFGGRHTPGFHVKVNAKGGRSITVWSLLAYMRSPAVQIPFDYVSKYPPYSDAGERRAALNLLNGLIPENERAADENAIRRPRLTLLSALDTAEALENFKSIMQQMMNRLRKGG